MAKGSIFSTEFDNGCKFELRWEQIQYPGDLYSVLKFEVYFHAAYDGASFINFKSYLGLYDSRNSNIFDKMNYANLRVEFTTRTQENRVEFIAEKAGVYKLDHMGYRYATSYGGNAPAGGTASDQLFWAEKIPHYSSGAPKAKYLVETRYPEAGISTGTTTDSSGRIVNRFSFPAATIELDPLSGSSDDPGGSGGTTPTISPSKITCADTYIGDYARISLTAYASGVKHTVSYSFGSLSGTIVSNDSRLALSWEVPYDFIYAIPTGASHGTCNLTCQTYDSLGNLIGTTTTSFIARMDVNKEAPTFDPDIFDNNSKTLVLTGDRNIFIRYYSEAYVITGAAAKAGATIANESVTCGNYNKSVSSPGYTFIISNIESGNFELTATDNRGATSKTTINRILIPYSKISCNVFDTYLSTDGTLTFQVQGNYFNESFGVVNNSLTIRYRINNGSYKTVSSANVSITGDNYVANVVVEGLDYSQVYTIEAYAEDKLSSAGKGETYNVTGEPLFDWGKDDFNFNVPVIVQSGLNVPVGRAIYGEQNGGLREALVPLDSTGNTTLGRGGYQEETGRTIIYGNEVDIIAHNGVTINGKTVVGHTDKVLWSGSNTMGENVSINLSDSISNQASGIVLVFSLFRNGSAENVSINSIFISKKEIELLYGAPHTVLMAINAGFSSFGAKYLYIYDDSIGGHEGNTSSGTAASGITFNNNNYVLRYVIGV